MPLSCVMVCDMVCVTMMLCADDNRKTIAANLVNEKNADLLTFENEIPRRACIIIIWFPICRSSLCSCESGKQGFCFTFCFAFGFTFSVHRMR